MWNNNKHNTYNILFLFYVYNVEKRIIYSIYITRHMRNYHIRCKSSRDRWHQRRFIDKFQRTRISDSAKVHSPYRGDYTGSVFFLYFKIRKTSFSCLRNPLKIVFSSGNLLQKKRSRCKHSNLKKWYYSLSTMLPIKKITFMK